MPWPGITDFSEAVQNPPLCFAGTDLENGLVATNPRGMPLVYSGAFACVYPVSIGGRTYAVRCFTREVSDQKDRYNALSDYLLNVLPPAFVHFEYVEDGISVRGTSYPLVKMEWVEGELLSSYVEAHLNDPDALRRIAAQWRGGTTSSLRGLRIAHNDLQHGNVMVQNDGNIRLVDYDGMFLPQFAGEKSPELGHKNYQHPERTSDDYADYVDNFPAMVIYLSLLAIAAEPQLWEFNNEDNLILARTDYADPKKSEVFRRLKSSSDSSVVELTEKLIECCDLAVADVPDLETALQGIRVTAPAPSSSAPPPPQRTPTQSTSARLGQPASSRAGSAIFDVASTPESRCPPTGILDTAHRRQRPNTADVSYRAARGSAIFSALRSRVGKVQNDKTAAQIAVYAYEGDFVRRCPVRFQGIGRSNSDCVVCRDYKPVMEFLLWASGDITEDERHYR